MRVPVSLFWSSVHAWSGASDLTDGRACNDAVPFACQRATVILSLRLPRRRRVRGFKYLAISISPSPPPPRRARHDDVGRGRQQSVHRDFVGTSRHVSLPSLIPRTGRVGGAIVLFDLHIAGGCSEAEAAATDGASIGQALSSTIIHPSMPSPPLPGTGSRVGAWWPPKLCHVRADLGNRSRTRSTAPSLQQILSVSAERTLKNVGATKGAEWHPITCLFTPLLLVASFQVTTQIVYLIFLFKMNLVPKMNLIMVEKGYFKNTLRNSEKDPF